MTGSGRHVAIAAARSSTSRGTRLTRAGSVGLSLPPPRFTVSTAHRWEVDDPDPDRFAMHLTNPGTQCGRWPPTYGRRTDGLCDFPVSHVYCRWCRRPSWIICLRRRAGPVTMRMKSSSGKVGSCGSEWSVCVGCCVALGPHWRVAVPPQTRLPRRRRSRSTLRGRRRPAHRRHEHQWLPSNHTCCADNPRCGD